MRGTCEASIPATHRTPFDVAPSARVVPVNDLPAAIGSAASYVVLGAGKTAVDACVWLLDNDVQPDRIRWIRPRDAWFYDRRHFQPLEQVAAIMEGISLDAEAGAQAANVEELFARLEAFRAARADRPVLPGRDVPRHDAERRRARRRAADRQRRQARPGAARRGRPDRARARRDRDEHRRAACRLHGARPARRPRHPDLRPRSDRAPAGTPPLAVLQRRPDRLR